MKVKIIKVGELETNCYLLEKNDEVVIIDPGADFEIIKKNIGDAKVVGCLVTHFHLDHIGALEECLSYYDLEINLLKSKNFNMKILNTPGHTPESKTFLFEEDNCMFVGDFIFNNGVGRTDLGGNINDMQKSLRDISEYSEDIIIYPGHGSKTTLAQEKKHFSSYF